MYVYQTSTPSQGHVNDLMVVGRLANCGIPILGFAQSMNMTYAGFIKNR